MNYNVIHSKRKTAAIQIKADGAVIVRAPGWYSDKMVKEFIKTHWSWVERKLAEQRQEQSESRRIILSEEERLAAIEKARIIFPQRVSYFADRMGVSYGRITIREQKTRWGSCSSKGNLNFNWRLVLAPESVLDYVVVHELAHRMLMNHSKDFYAIVAQVIPDYEEARVWLRTRGRSIL